MRKLLLAGLGGLAILAGTEANAADVLRKPVYKAPPAPRRS
jgi:hypothetical protein